MTDYVILRLHDYEKTQLEHEAIRHGMTKSELIPSLIARFLAPVARTQRYAKKGFPRLAY